MFIKPAEGMVIPDLARNDVLPAEGRDVPETDFWLRRLNDGDVVAVATVEFGTLETAPGGPGATASEPTHEGT